MVIHALQRGQFPDRVNEQPMTCATCGTTGALVLLLPAMGILARELTPRIWAAWAALAALAALWSIQVWQAWRAANCERPMRGNLLVALSRWVQKRWFVSPPTAEEWEMAVACGRALLAAAGRKK